MKLIKLRQKKVFNLNYSQTIKIVIPAPALRRDKLRRESIINNLVQEMDARLLGHDSIEIILTEMEIHEFSTLLQNVEL